MTIRPRESGCLRTDFGFCIGYQNGEKARICRRLPLEEPDPSDSGWWTGQLSSLSRLVCLIFSYFLLNREAIKKIKSFNKELFLKGGRGSIWKPIFLKVKNKEIFARREGVNVKISLFFFSILSDFLKGFLKEIIL